METNEKYFFSLINLPPAQTFFNTGETIEMEEKNISRPPQEEQGIWKTINLGFGHHDKEEIKN